MLDQPQCICMSAAFVSAEEIRTLNAQYRGIDRETDVLSFPSAEFGRKVIDPSLYPFETDEKNGLLYVGDVFICTEIAKKQAQEYGHGFDRECAFLLLHGFLHLLGYDHMTAEDEREMNGIAEKVLANCGLER